PLEIDPFDSNRMMYGTGATVYGTENRTAWDSGGQFKVTPMVKGLEGTAVNDLASPPSGAPLLSALGDIGGFRHTDLDAVPAA
ncbi:xyloglucanase, partial [Streptomyces sp. JAC128]